MKQILMAAVVTAVALTCATSEAAGRPRLFQNNGQTMQRGDGPFARLMEMERRKNAALRQMFFNR